MSQYIILSMYLFRKRIEKFCLNLLKSRLIQLLLNLKLYQVIKISSIYSQMTLDIMTF